MVQKHLFNLYLARTAGMLSGARRVAMMLVTFLLTMTAQTAWAEVTYQWDGDTKTLTFSGSGELIYEVSDSGHRYDVKTAVIGSGVTSIIGAFYDCSNLTTVTFEPGSQLTSIGDNAFANCSNLTSIAIPNSVTTIGFGAFTECYGLKSFIIPASVTSIENDAFFRCNLEIVVVQRYTSGESPITSLVDDPFDGCDALKMICVPNDEACIAAYKSASNWDKYEEKIQAINNYCGDPEVNDGKNVYYAYYLQPGTQEVTLAIAGSGAMDNNNAQPWLGFDVKTVNIGYGVTSISQYAFYNRNSLTSVPIPSSVTSIGNNAFEGCTGLTSITIPASVESIGELAFDKCTGLTSVTIPSSVTSIEGGAFNGCSNLESINVDVNNQNYASEDGVLFNKDKTILIKYPIGKSGTSYDIPASVTSIGENAFNGCNTLTSITIPASVTSIGGDAFIDCINMADVYCYADPTKLTWGDTGDNFGTQKPKCHVADADAWSGFSSVNVTFVGDLADVSIPYIDADGNTAYCTDFTVIDGTEDELGTSGQTTWYIVPSTATGNNALSYKGRLKLNGDVHLILADGSKMTADGTDDPESGHFVALDAGNSGQLTIYGQANGTGELNAITGSGSRAFNVTGTGCALTICGGVVNAKADFAFNGTSLIIHGGKFTTVAEEGITDNISINATNVQINGGEVTIGGYIQSGTGDVEINGGKVDVSGNIQSTSGDIILGWTNASDHITAVLYQTNTSQDHNVKIADGKVLKYTDGTVKLLHTGIVAPSVISGKELTPYGIFGYCGKTSENGGKNVYWSIALNDDPETDAIYSNTLVIEKNNNASGQTNFDMANYRNDNSGNFAPWIKPNNAGNESDGLKYPITAVTIADGVTSIGGEAFENCRSLQNVTIGSSVTSIGNQAFDHCSGLQIVTIGNSVTSIGYQAFDYCSGLQKVNIGNSVTTIGNCAFRECRGLQEVNIGSSVTTIGDHAFENCRELQNVTIPASVTTINGDAFRTCINLTVVTMRPSTPPSLQNSDVFRDCDLKLIIVPNETAYTAYNGAGEGWDGKISENINTSPEDITYKSLLAPSVISLAKNASGWGTYCHGYPVSYSLSEGATAYTLSGLNNDKTAVTIQETAVTIQETDVNAVAPLTPLLLNYTAPDNDAETDDETVTLTALPATATTDSYGAIVSNGGTGCTFYGNATGTTLMHDPNSDPDDGIPALIGGWPTYILRNGTFVLVDTDEGIPAHRCVLSVGSSNAARVLTIGTGDETTGIEELKNGRIEELKSAGTWYSLDGRKLDKQPTKKGLYIYNGKKTVIK